MTEDNQGFISRLAWRRHILDYAAVWTGVIQKKNDAGEHEGVVWWGLEGGSGGGGGGGAQYHSW